MQKIQNSHIWKIFHFNKKVKSLSEFQGGPEEGKQEDLAEGWDWKAEQLDT